MGEAKDREPALTPSDAPKGVEGIKGEGAENPRASPEVVEKRIASFMPQSSVRPARSQSQRTVSARRPAVGELRRNHRAAPGFLSAAGGPAAGGRRPERRRQDDFVQCHRRHETAERRLGTHLRARSRRRHLPRLCSATEPDRLGLSGDGVRSRHDGPGPRDRAAAVAERRDRDIVRGALDQVGLADLAERSLGDLSGGQQRRVFLAQALAQEAELILLDEPLRGLELPQPGGALFNSGSVAFRRRDRADRHP